MPQLHDSGSRLDAQTQPSMHHDDFARVFGLETEYGVSVTGVDTPVDAGQVAMTMFQPVVRQARSTNTYLNNGARLYLDVGAHPEYATAEAICPFDALTNDLAGERIMRAMALDAQRRLRSNPTTSNATVHLYKNNADSAGHSFGCHENYLVRRFIGIDAIEHILLPFLITRQIYTGAGRFDGERLLITQRASFVDETVSSATTRSRPMVNTRDEPHANPEEFRRLHVIIGDSNRSQWAILMKCATTHLVLCAMEDAARSNTLSELSAMAFADPIAANHAVNEHGAYANIALANGKTLSALEIQRWFFDRANEFLFAHAATVELTLRTDPLCSPDWIIKQWEWALDMLGDNDIEALSHVVDWAAKRMFFTRLEARGSVAPARLQQLDMDYHDVANGKLYNSLCSHGYMRTFAADQQISTAVHTPPSHTRAQLRGAFVREAKAKNARYDCDWTQLRLLQPVRMEATMLDPFSNVPNEQVTHIMDYLEHLSGHGSVDMPV